MIRENQSQSSQIKRLFNPYEANSKLEQAKPIRNQSQIVISDDTYC